MTPGPRTLVALEFGRALGAALLAPLRVLAYVVRAPRLRTAFRRDLEQAAAVDEPGDLPADWKPPRRIFVSCAERSGETHAVHLVEALRALCGDSGTEFTGLGGERLRAAGVRTVGDPVERAAMGADVLAALPFYLGLLRDAATELRERPPELFIAVDSPALHVPLGRIAGACGVPVAHFATPQYWAWAPWRVQAYRRAVDLALTILPFEPSWFRRHGVNAVHAGHPHLDALEHSDTVDTAPPRPLRLVLLPGSRRSVIRRNLPWMIVAAGRLRLVLPELEVVLPHEDTGLEAELRAHVERAGAENWIRIETGRLHDTLRGARAALSVSGTVLLDLLWQRLPAVVIYRLESAFAQRATRHVLTVPWFSSVNLLADCEVYPEFTFAGEGPLEEVCAALRSILEDQVARRLVKDRLDVAARRLGPSGATRRAAAHALHLAHRSSARS